VAPRLEQRIRAELFCQHELVDVLHPEELNSVSLSTWLASPPVHAKPRRERIDLGACAKVRANVESMFPELVAPLKATTGSVSL
jgi:predicted glycosyltransferase